MTKLADRTDIPTLSGGWINLTEAAELLGQTRSYMYKLAAKSPAEGGFKTLHKIGTNASYVVNRKEIDKMVAAKGEPEKELAMEDILAQV